ECDKECPENRMCNIDDECICAYGYTPDTNGECQEIQCNEITEVACTLDRGERWCCPYDTFCGDRIGLCIPFEGFCVYRFYDNSNEGISYTTDCSYIVGSTDVIEKYETDCSYIVTGKTPNINLSANKQCPASNQYCVLKWSKESWGSNEKEPTLSGPESGTIYGKCQMMSVFDTMPIVTYYEGGRIVYPHINCQEQGQYCVLKWSKDSWGSNEKEPTLSGPESGTIYGKCQMMSVFDSDPIIKSTDIDNTTYRIEKDCPTKQYCHLQWKNENCNTISGNATGLIYGVCADMNEKNNVCPISNNN
ncbi:MAG: hypothetical protein IKY98_03660, partial [Alphaproteobacteria bacterium]|nr:hypothetical protein [Alphaproteobacteria bacterium]